MSVDPGQYAAARDRGSSSDTAVSLRAGDGYAGEVGTASAPPEVEIRFVEVLPLRQGDRLIIHVDGTVGMSAGGGQRAGEQVRDILKLGELPFDVPMLVVSPGFRIEVARPA